MNGRSGERGALMVGLMAAVAIMLILSTVAFQSWEDVIRRDKEAEMIFRGQEYARGLKRYQKAQGTLPTELKKLMEKTGTGQYVMRRLYPDPLVKDGKWGLLFLNPAGAGGIIDPNAEGENGLGSGQSTGTTGSPFGSGTSTSTSGFGSGTSTSTTGFGSAFGQQALGGGEQQGLPIAGVKSLCKAKPFRVFREQDEYSRWLFTILDNDLLGPVPGKMNPNNPNNPGGVPGSNMGNPGSNMGNPGSNMGNPGSNMGNPGSNMGNPGGGSTGIKPPTPPSDGDKQ